jgi:hypothetical protein
MGRNDTLPVDIALLSYIRAAGAIVIIEILQAEFLNTTSSKSLCSKPPSVSLEARPETRIDNSVLRTSPFGGGSSSRPSAYRVSDPRMESEGRENIPDNEHMVQYSPIPSLGSCKLASTCSGTCNTLLSQTFWTMRCARKKSQINDQLDRTLTLRRVYL